VSILIIFALVNKQISGIMNIIQRAVVVVALLLSMLNVSVAQDASKKQMAYFVTGDTVVCDAGTVTMSVYVDLAPQVVFTLVWVDEMEFDGKSEVIDKSLKDRNVPNDHVFVSKELLDLSADSSGKHVRHKLTLKSLYSQATGEITINDTMIVDIWGTPTPSIVTDSKVCSDAVTVEADGRWSDVSAYKWNAVLPDGSALDLKDADTRLCQASYPRKSDVDIKFTLVESTGGGVCAAEASKTMNFLEVPTSTLKHLDDDGDETDVKICSSVRDEAFDFEGVLNLTGHEPFDVVMSNGQEFLELPAGETTQLLHNERAHELRVTKLTDANKCVIDYPSEKLSGQINIVDRKPIVEVPTDTLYFEGRSGVIKRALSELGSDFFWSIRRDSIFYEGYKVDNITGPSWKRWASEGVGEWHFRTNKTGMLYLDYYEMNYEVVKNDTLVECPSDVVLQCVSTYEVVNAPNGISPNSDRKNDYLVIEGIPDENRLIVFDQKGKVVFEKTNYRNDWNAQELEDGYYVYVFEGDGIKTVKETLVIKRSK